MLGGKKGAQMPKDFAPAAWSVITTGTLTDAFPVAPGQVWTARYGTLGVRGIELAFR